MLRHLYQTEYKQKWINSSCECVCVLQMFHKGTDIIQESVG